MKKLINQLLQSRFVKDSLILFSGNVINQIILLSTYPIISRLFLPSDFGTYEQVHAIFSFLVILASLRYESAIIISKSDQEAKNLLVLCLSTVVLLVVFVWVCIGAGGDFIADLFSNPKLTRFLYFLPIFLLLAGWQQVLYNWEIRKKCFSRANTSNIFKSSSNSIIRVLVGFTQLSTLGLFLARGISHFLALWVLLKNEWKEIIQAIKQRVVSTHRVISAAKTFKDFPLYMSWGVIFNRMSMAIIPLVISYLYGVKFLGYYAMANTALNIPIVMVKNAIRTIYLQRASEIVRNRKNLHNDLKKISKVLSISGILPLLLIMLYGRTIFTFVLGDIWQMTGEIAIIISPWIFITLIAAPYTAVIPVIGLQRYYVIYQFILLSTRILVLYIGAIYFTEPLNLIKVLVIHGILVNIFNLGYVLTKTRR